MIRINLLPVREARRKADLQQQLMMLGAALVGALVLCAVFHQTVASQVRSSRARVVQLRQQLQAFKPQQAQMEDFKARRAEIERKLNVIHTLERSRSGPVRVLDELATHMPERVWLTHMRTEAGAIQLEGMSLDNELVARLLTALGNSPYFAEVELESTELKTVDELKLNTFEIRARLSSPDAPPGAPGAPGAPGTAAPGTQS